MTGPSVLQEVLPWLDSTRNTLTAEQPVLLAMCSIPTVNGTVGNSDAAKQDL